MSKGRFFCNVKGTVLLTLFFFEFPCFAPAWLYFPQKIIQLFCQFEYEILTQALIFFVFSLLLLIPFSFRYLSTVILAFEKPKTLGEK